MNHRLTCEHDRGELRQDGEGDDERSQKHSEVHHGVRNLPIGGGGGRGTQFVRGRSRMTINPRIPTMPGRSTSGFHHPGKHCLHQKREAGYGAMRVAWRVNRILPRTARKTDFGTLCLLSRLWMTAPMSYFVFWCGHSRDRNGYYSYVTASWVPYHIHTGTGEGRGASYVTPGSDLREGSWRTQREDDT